MRLDKYLFFVRLTKTRALAQAILNEGHVRVDGRPMRHCHGHIAPGQTITIPLHDAVRVFRIEALPQRRGPASEAAACYTDLACNKSDD
jgi:ribosome-associated heat shock protein Hsp15